MNFRRQPFQFTAIDPAKRQAELQKRFGLPTNNSDMFVDFLNPSMMGSGVKEPLSSGSPRLQHRVPIFSENAEKLTAEQNNVDSGHKPRVRVVPIQVEGVDGGKRHQTHSGPVILDCNNIPKGKLQETFPHLNSTKKVEECHPKVCNIPVQIEPREKQHNVEKIKVEHNPKPSEPAKKLISETNGCAASVEKTDLDKSLSLKQIEKVLNKLNEYKQEVEKFTGTSKDKQYRYLDEMLTRCMLDLDNVDTMGLDEIRKARKEAVRQVQHYVDLLDTKVNMNSDLSAVTNSNDIPFNSDITSELTESESVETMESGLSTVLNSAEDSTESDIPVNSNINKLAMSKVASTSVEVETNSACSSENKIGNENIVDVEMTEEALIDTITNESMDVSTQDDLIDNMTESSIGQQEGPIKSQMPEVEMEEPAMCNKVDLETKESKVIIEELSDIEGETNNSTSNVIDSNNAQCIISDSPELSVKETIVEEEEGDSEIVIEEVECENSIQDNNHSFNSCDNSSNENNKLSEQLSIKDNYCSVTEPVVQENIDSKNL